MPGHGQDPAQPLGLGGLEPAAARSPAPVVRRMDGRQDQEEKLLPLKRWQEPEDIAAMAVFLASKQGQNIAGQTINVDGGYVMHW